MEGNYATTQQLQQVIDYLQKGAERFGAIEERCKNIETSVRKLERITIEGNGHSSLMHELGLVQHKLEGVDFPAIRSDLDKLAEQSNGDKQTEAEERAAKWNRRTAIMCAAISAVSALVAALVKFL
jgi:hypothetical protein